MIIAGGGGHAKEVFGVFAAQAIAGEIFYFDDLSAQDAGGVFENLRRVKKIEEAAAIFLKDPGFVLGVGKPAMRKQLTEKLTAVGGVLTSVISPTSHIGKSSILGGGLNIMTGAVITEDAVIGKGTLVHINVTIHHDCTVGEFCELSPGCHILGKVTIGNYTSVGAGAVLLPGVKVGENVTIAAGAVVTKNIDDGVTVKGIPAR